MKSKHAQKGFTSGWDSCFLYRPLLSTLLIVGLVSGAHAAPEGGVVRAGNVQIVDQGSKTLIRQSSQRAIIDWRGFGIDSNEQVRFVQPSAGAATLNRVTGSQVSMILGRMDANGQVLLINPNGIIFGKGARINVGSLVASTANLSNENFMQGKLIFDQPGKPGAGIVNSGSITAAEGGLIALVAPHVRNDGMLQARMGKVTLGAADTFTIDLYGDGLINFALSDESLTQLKDAQGQPVKNLINQAGTIDVGGGKTVLVTAEAAKGMLDSLINLSGAILADSAVQDGGRILLLARGGNVDVGGNLSARGTAGGRIDVLGDQVHLASTAKLDAEGTYGGGTLHVGGAFQGSGDTYRAQSVQIDAGATLHAGALARGDGGEVVVWSDGSTAYAGSIRARGGAEGGDGGLVEVSGKRTLNFTGLVDAGAAFGRAGSLLLDPYDFTIGMAEASLINRVLRTGTSTSVSADNDINVNSFIDGRGMRTGGGVTLSAGNNLNISDYIVTNNGAINLFAAAGSVNLAPGNVVYAGTAPINVRGGGNLYTGFYFTGGPLSLISTRGSVFINEGIDPSVGELLIQAAGDVNVNQPIVSHSDGNSVNINAGNDVAVNAQIDGRPASGVNPNGAVTMTAGRDIYLNRSILADRITLTAGLGTISAPTMKAGTVTVDGNGIPHGEGLFAGTGPISVTAGGNLSSGIYVTTGPVFIRSTGGSIHVDTKLAEILGNVTIQSDTGSVNVDQEIANIRSGSNLAITAGTDINLNRQIDALDDSNPLSITPVPGGSVTFTSGNNVNLNRDLATFNGPVDITATAGTLNIAWDAANVRTRRIQTGSAPITVTTGGNLSTGTAPAPPATTFPWNPAWVAEMTFEEGTKFKNDYIGDQLRPWVAFSTTGKLSLTSTGSDVTVDAPIPDTTGEVAMTAADAIVVNHKVLSNNQPITLTAGAGGITINSTNDTYDIGVGNSPAIDSGSGPLTLRAVGDVSITTENGIATKGKLTIDTRGRILQGSVYNNSPLFPSEIELTADQGIGNGNENVSFNARYSPRISAISKYGNIHLAVYYPKQFPGQLYIEATQGSISTGGFLGPDVSMLAGRDINLTSVYESGMVKLTAGRDANLNVLDVIGLDVTAANNIHFKNFSNPDIISPVVISPVATVWLGGGNLTATSTGGNIIFGGPSEYSAVHIGDGKNLTLNAYGAVELGSLETSGPVSITAQTGNITLRNDIGPSIQYYNLDTPEYYSPYVPAKDRTPSIYGDKRLNDPAFDPAGIGVASLMLNAGGNIDMEGAKAVGTVAITAGGVLTPAKGIYSGTSNGLSINAAGGALEKLSGGDIPYTGPFTFAGTSFGDIPLGVQAQQARPEKTPPPIAPGPAVAPPSPPGAMTALAALPPGLATVPGNPIPSGHVPVGGSITPGPELETEENRQAGSVQLSEIIPVEDEEGDDETRRKEILKISDGRGVGQAVVIGRR